MLSFYLLGAKKIFSFLKKAFLVITVYFVIISLFLNLSNKEKKIKKVSLLSNQKNNLKIDPIINNEELKKTKYGKYSIEIYKLYNCIFFGDLCNNNSKKNYENSVFGQFYNLNSFLYLNPPASFTFWASNSLNKASLIPKTFAENKEPSIGLGMQSISIFYKLWENFRNLSFLIITLILIGIGFMIMFRTKINPQTVISIENALPKIIISMILITFSYPIAGLLIDLMYISLSLVAGLFKNILYMPIDDFSKNLKIEYIIPPYNSLSKIGFVLSPILNTLMGILKPIISNRSVLDLTYDQFINDNVFGIVFDFFNFNLYTKTINDIISGSFITQSSILQSLFKYVSAFIIILILALLINPIGTFFTNIIGDPGQGAGLGFGRIIFFGILTVGFLNLFIFFIVILGMLFLAFRIFFFLLSCFFNLIIYIILAPIYLLLEGIPGKNSFSSWIKNIIANLIVFPGYLFIILLQKSLYVLTVNQDIPFLSLPGLNFYIIPGSDPVNIQTSLNFFMSFLNLYIILSTPDFLKLIKTMIIGKEGLSLPASPGILFGGAGATTGSILSFANQFYYLKQGYETFFGKKDVPATNKGQQTPEPEKNAFREAINQGFNWLKKKFGV